MRMILPAAGFGTRAKMKKNQSKELLINPSTKKPLIQYHLDIAQQYMLDPLVITRKEKKDLISFCKKNKIDYQVITPEGEWSNTVLMSQNYWHEYNILALPDTVYEPHFAVWNIKKGLELGSQSVIAFHHVDDVSKWGSISNYKLYEKRDLEDGGYAWGLIGFKKDYGRKLFEAMAKKGEPFTLKDTSFTYLEWFEDLTRKGKL